MYVLCADIVMLRRVTFLLFDYILGIDCTSSRLGISWSIWSPWSSLGWIFSLVLSGNGGRLLRDIDIG